MAMYWVNENDTLRGPPLDEASQLRAAAVQTGAFALFWLESTSSLPGFRDMQYARSVLTTVYCCTKQRPWHGLEAESRPPA